MSKGIPGYLLYMCICCSSISFFLFRVIFTYFAGSYFLINCSGPFVLFADIFVGFLLCSDGGIFHFPFGIQALYPCVEATCHAIFVLPNGPTL